MVWRESLKERYPVPDFEVAYPTVNFGRIFGGDSPNRICPSCELHFDIRLVPGMDIEQTRGELQSRVYEAINGMGFTVEIFHLFPGVPPMQTPADSHLVRHAEQITGAKARAVQFATEGYFYNTFGMDTIILGPGDINTAHQPDEYLNSAVIKPAVNVYRSLIQALCIQED
jgi:acetylornithine deacetylase